MLEVRNPATLELIAALEVPGKSDIRAAVDESAGAFLRWRKTPWAVRQEALLGIAAAVEARRFELAAVLTAEQGKPLYESKRELSVFIDVLRMYASMTLPGESLKHTRFDSVTVSSEPLGPCALILPWNYPVGILGWKLAPCLLAGNTALVKPSPYAPLTVLEVLGMASAHLPDNVVRGLPGGDAAGKALVSQKGIRKISFTGSRDAGRDIMERASQNFPRITLEMGGNDAAIIMKDCDLGKRFENLFWGCFFNAGQICVAIKRIYVHESLAPELIRRFGEKAKTLVVGNGLDDGTQMGPLNNERQLLRVEGLVDDAVERGATPVCGGSRYSGKRKAGYFYRPTVVTDLDDSFAIVKEEQFGPAIPILTFRDIRDAVAGANDTDYGLGGSVWTKNIARGLEIASRLECGTAWVNAHMLIEQSAPFGGVKSSGIGRELGRPGLQEYTQFRTTCLVK